MPVTHTATETTVPARQRLWVRAIAAAAAAALVNAVLYAAAVAAGIFPQFRIDPAAGPQMAVELVIFVSVLGALAGVGVYALVRRFAADPRRSFLILAGVVLVVSFAGPFAVPGNTLAQALVLNVLHVTTAAIVVAAVLYRR